MPTEYRGYTEIPGAVTPDVPYRVNLALREVDADMHDLDKKTQAADVVLAGRIAAVETAGGITGPVLGLQDQMVAALILGVPFSASRVAMNTATEVEATAQQSTPGSPLARATAQLIRDEAITPWGTGPLSVWGAALMGQLTRAAVWVSLGSSTANGGNTSSVSLAWHHRLTARLTPNASIRLDAAGARPATGVQTYSGAVGGTNSSNYLTPALVAKINTLRPDLITHMVGSNDWAANTVVATYKTRMRDWLTQLMAGTPDTVHVLIHQQARWDTVGGTNTWAAYGVALAELAKEFPDKVLYLNLDQHYKPLGFPSADYYSLMTSDKIHMNDAGHAILADLIGDFIGAPPVSYLPREVYRAETFAGGAITASTTIASLTIPARPYPRAVSSVATAYVSAVTGNADLMLSLAAASNPRATASRQTGSAAKSTSLSGAWTLPAHTEGTVVLTANGFGGGLTVSSNAGYMALSAECSPLYN